MLPSQSWEARLGEPPLTAGRGAYPGIEFPGVRLPKPHPPAALAEGGRRRGNPLGRVAASHLRRSGGGPFVEALPMGTQNKGYLRNDPFGNPLGLWLLFETEKHSGFKLVVEFIALRLQ